MSPAFLALSAGSTGVANTMAESITAGVTNAVTLLGNAFDAITGNTVMCIFLGFALVRGGLGVFRSMRHSVN